MVFLDKILIIIACVIAILDVILMAIKIEPTNTYLETMETVETENKEE